MGWNPIYCYDGGISWLASQAQLSHWGPQWVQDPCAPSLHFETHVADLSASAAAAEAAAAGAAGAAVAAAAGAAAVAPVGAVAADGGVAVAEALTAVGVVVVVDLAVDAAVGFHQGKLGGRPTSQWAGCVESQETAPGVH